jgi:glycosyltransferase involved in cell wall biosynthesis
LNSLNTSAEFRPAPEACIKTDDPGAVPEVTPPTEIEIGLLTGGFDRPYAFGLAMALASKGIVLDVIGSDEVDSPEMHTTPQVNFVNLQGNPRQKASLGKKLWRLFILYARLIRYAATARPRIFHILWNYKIQAFDRTVLMVYYKLLGKKVVLTAHNVNAGKRDANDSLLNRLSLRAQYRLADHIFVHTEKMKRELGESFRVRKDSVTVIPFGINNAVPNTQLSPADAKQRLGIENGERTILFFGAIQPYKGLEFLVAAFQRIAKKDKKYRLIIVGESKKESRQYVHEIQEAIARDPSCERVIQKIEFVPDSETELYFKAADVLVLPYTLVFQSGVLFLAYSFGLPVVAADVGSFREDVIEGETGLLCKPCDATDMARVIEAYFESHLFTGLNEHRQEIRDYAAAKHSWYVVAEMTRNVYEELLEGRGHGRTSVDSHTRI